MPNTKISNLSVMTSAAAGDLIPIVDISDLTMAASGTTKRVTQSVLLASAQPLDATLTALAGLTIAANSLAVGTGADAFTQTTFAANTLPARASTGSLVAKPITDFGLSLIDDAAASNARTTLGLGTIATQDASSVAISGGTINGATVGATTPATGVFTSLSSTTGAKFATSSGNVGIGTLTPLRILHIVNNDQGGYRLERTTATATVFDTYISSAGKYSIYDGTAGADRFTINAAGFVGIGTFSPSYQLHVNTDSAGKPGTGGLWTVVSDERIKTDIVPADLSRCYDIVKQVGLKHFGFKPGVYSDEQINDKHSLGWIAQDVQKVFGKAVSIKPFTLHTDIPDGTEEYEEQEFTVETVNKVENSIQVINGKPVQASKTTQVEEKTLLFDEVVVVDVAGDIVMVDGAPLTHKVPRMVTKTRPKVRREVIEDCLDLNGGQMNAALYGAVQCLMSKVEAQAVTIASLQASVAEQAHS